MASAVGYRSADAQLRSISPTAWPNPLQPIRPIGPPGSKLLEFPFLMGQNLSYTPNFDAEYSSARLKILAGYPLAEACINNVKDQVCQTSWTIQLREKKGEPKAERDKRASGDPIILKLSRMFEEPDGENMWSEWLRPFIDAALVTDSGSLEPMRTKSGKLIGLSVLLGSDQIGRYVDDTGRTPQPPDAAYAQLWEGIPRTEATTDELIYRPRNIQPRNTISSYLYGTSNVAQCAKWIEIGIARLLFVYAYYRTGSIPDMIQVAPSTTTADKIKEASMWWNSEFAGQLDKRRGLSIIQGFQTDGKPDQFLFPKEPLLTDKLDDLLIRQITFTIGTSAQRLQPPMNRASGQSNQEAAEEEGTRPIINFTKSVIDQIIQRRMGYYDYEMAFDINRENDVLKAAQADEIRTGNALQTFNEARVNNGDEPVTEAWADQLGFKTAQGWIPVGEIYTPQGTLPVGQLLPTPAPTAAPKKPPAKKRLIERGDPTPMFSIEEPLRGYVNGHG